MGFLIVNFIMAISFPLVFIYKLVEKCFNKNKRGMNTFISTCKFFEKYFDEKDYRQQDGEDE